MESEIVNKINTCRNFINTLSRSINDYDKTVSWFKDFCDLLSNVLVSTIFFVKQLKETSDRNVSRSLLLYLTQLITLLSLLIKIFVKENELHEIINEARYSVSKQLIICLDCMSAAIQKETIEEHYSGSFIKWVDLSLNSLALIDVNDSRDVLLMKYDGAYKHVEEVLCHAMSIAQVAYSDDCKIIKGGSQTVLDSLKLLRFELNNEELHIGMCNISIDSCYDKLCALERKVNTSVLKLSLRVFSTYMQPLEALYAYTFEVENERNETKFDQLIADFDLHVDRIMQIGLFAIATSSNSASAVKMKSCLASLEALEGELIPSFNAVILNKSQHNISYALILKAYWIQQAECLKNLIYSIIDPFAFCQVSYEELKTHIDDISELMKIQDGFLDKKLLEPIFIEMKVLIQVILTTIEDSQLFNTDEVKTLCREIKIVSNEIKSAATQLLTDMKSNRQNSLRVTKRCKILQSSVKKLLLSLSENLNVPEDELNKENTLKDVSNIISINEVKNLTDNEFPNYIMTKGKEILKDRSVLYKTPTKNRTNVNTSKTQSKLHDKPMPLSKLVHLRNLQFSYSRIRNETPFELQITDILDDLENLSASFTRF